MFGNHVDKKLSAYLDGELPQEEARRVAEHLLLCQSCRNEHEEIKFGAQMAAQLTREQAPEFLWNELENVISRGTYSQGGAMEKVGRSHGKFGFTWSPLTISLACVPILLLAGLGFIYFSRQSTPNQIEKLPSWEVTRLEGKPAIGNQQIDEKGRWPIGEWLVTDDSSRAQISVGQIGEVKIEPNSRVRLVEAREDSHRLALQRGRMEAFIWAPPRQFFVDTPSAVAVDLGCSYTLEVNDDGVALLHVTMGWVAFEWQGRESFVPADAMCLTRPGIGPGTPYFSDATKVLQTSLERFDTAGTDQAARAGALDTVLEEARRRDALTLWHLLARTGGDERGRVFDRLAKLVPPPPKITRSGVLNGEREMLDVWWNKLELGDTEWWRMWKGALPAQTK